MGLFGKKKETVRAQQEEMVMCDCGSMCKASDIEVKKTAQTKKAGCCDGDFSIETMTKATKAKEQGYGVKVLGSGCVKCNQLEVATRTALEQLGMDSSIDHVTDFAQIAAYGVMTTPALVVDGKVVSYGKVLKIDEVVVLLKKARG